MSQKRKQDSPPSHFEHLQKKAKLCVAIAKLMLRKQAIDQMVENQALALMHLPDPELRATRKRLAASCRAAKPKVQS